MKKVSGYYRTKKGTGFTYKNENDRTIVSTAIRNWIDGLAVPPAWRDVWISKDKNAYLLATGYDKKDKKQYIYHPQWEAIRNEKKFSRMVLLSQALPKIRTRLKKDLAQKSPTKSRVLAAVVCVIDQTGARVGHDTYTQENGSYGITTIRKKHTSGASVKKFDYLGKSSQERHLSIEDPAVVKVIRECEETAGYELFKYIDEKGDKQSVSADEVNEYIRTISGKDITAKDFRTWYGSVVALQRCNEIGECGEECYPKHMKTIFAFAAKALGNTPKVAADSYVHVAVIDAHVDNSLKSIHKPATTWRTAEEEVLHELLKLYEETV